MSSEGQLTLTLSPTDEFNLLGLVPTRIWAGVDDQGVPVRVAVSWIFPQTDDRGVAERYEQLLRSYDDLVVVAAGDAA